MKAWPAAGPALRPALQLSRRSPLQRPRVGQLRHQAAERAVRAVGDELEVQRLEELPLGGEDLRLILVELASELVGAEVRLFDLAGEVDAGDHDHLGEREARRGLMGVRREIGEGWGATVVSEWGEEGRGCGAACGMRGGGEVMRGAVGLAGPGSGGLAAPCCRARGGRR